MSSNTAVAMSPRTSDDAHFAVRRAFLFHSLLGWLPPLGVPDTSGHRGLNSLVLTSIRHPRGSEVVSLVGLPLNLSLSRVIGS